eukprot:TRINITY_DN5802_c0_g2_i1.p1 TRINITY_DN5802_c0_g2~~TRINITY_DN5802_c0_g2_i1.p1  ORF type:complete len:368 (-),score=94.30 TRINITY_DN5802_c0_g2_i1:181-1284(-)
MRFSARFGAVIAALLLNTADAQRKLALVGSFGGYPVETMSFDMETGSLSSVGNTFAGYGPDWFAFSRDYSKVFMTGEVDLPLTIGSVTSWSIDRASGQLELISNVSLDTPTHVALHPSERWIFTASWADGTTSVLPVKPDGSLGSPTKYSVGEHVHETVIDPTGRFVLVPCLGSDYIAQFLFDAETGVLTPNNPPYAKLVPGTGPRHLIFHPSYQIVYEVNEVNSSIVTWDYSFSTGTLSNPRYISTLPSSWQPGSSIQYAAEIHITRDARYLYASNRSPNATGLNNIAIYDVSPTGQLFPKAWESGGGDINYPRYFSIDDSNRWLLVANQLGMSVTTFEILPNGYLRKAGNYPATNLTSFVTVLPF